MSEADFFAQSVLHWQRRIGGFLEMHGAGDKGGDMAPMTQEDLADLEARAEAMQSA